MRKMMKKTIAMAMATMMAMSMVACGGNKEASESGGDGGDQKVLRIGCMGPLTGAAASYGISVKEGATVAVNEINEKGLDGEMLDVKLELISEDDQAEPQIATNAYAKLISDNIHVLLGPTTSGACLAVNKLAQKDNLLMVTPSGSADKITEPSNVYRICFTDPLQGIKIADLIADTLKYKKVALLYDVSSDYGKGIHDAFVKRAKTKGLEIVADQSFSAGDKDFKTQLTTIKSSGAEVVFVPGYYQEASFILTQAHQNGLKLPFIGSDGWDGVTAQLGAKANVANGALFLSPFFSADTAENVKNFVALYEKEFGKTPDQFAADAYDGIYAIAKAYKMAGSTDSDKLQEAIKDVEIDGVTGKFSFDKHGEPNKDAKYIKIQDGKYTLFEVK